MNRLPRRTETALFRILQEALTNVHRHSNSKAVEVHISSDETNVVLIVRDFGKGLPREVLDRLWKTGKRWSRPAWDPRAPEAGTLLKATIPVSSAPASMNQEEDQLWSHAEYSSSILPLE